MKCEHYALSDDGVFPNSNLPLLVYPGAFAAADPGDIEKTFSTCHWPAAWRSTIFDFHHYHSTAHEALGAFRGRATLQFGGENGIVLKVETGDAIVIPAGVAHRCLEQTDGFCMVGAYPDGQPVDTCYGRTGERPLADTNIASVSLPMLDPVAGVDGPLTTLWSVG